MHTFITPPPSSLSLSWQLGRWPTNGQRYWMWMDGFNFFYLFLTKTQLIRTVRERVTLLCVLLYSRLYKTHCVLDLFWGYLQSAERGYRDNSWPKSTLWLELGTSINCYPHLDDPVSLIVKSVYIFIQFCHLIYSEFVFIM